MSHIGDVWVALFPHSTAANREGEKIETWSKDSGVVCVGAFGFSFHSILIPYQTSVRLSRKPLENCFVSRHENHERRERKFHCKAPRRSTERAEKSSRTFLHTFPHSLFTFSCESFGPQLCVSFFSTKKFLLVKIPSELKFFVVSASFLVLWPKTFSRMVNKKGRAQASVEPWEVNPARHRPSASENHFSVATQGEKNLYNNLFSTRKKKENSKIPTFFLCERRKLRRKKLCCVWSEEESGEERETVKRVERRVSRGEVFLFLFAGTTRKKCTKYVETSAVTEVGLGWGYKTKNDQWKPSERKFATSWKCTSLTKFFFCLQEKKKQKNHKK